MTFETTLRLEAKFQLFEPKNQKKRKRNVMKIECWGKIIVKVFVPFLCQHVRRLVSSSSSSTLREHSSNKSKSILKAMKCFYENSSPGFCVSTSMSGSGLTSPISSLATRFAVIVEIFL